MRPAPPSPSALRGHLEDLPLIDMIQIVAFAKKTGFLQIQSPRGRGGIVFNEGLVVCAYSWSTLRYLRQIGDDPHGGHKLAILKKQIEISLRELAALREGSFYFQVTDAVPVKIEGMPVASFVLDEGIHPEGLLLELAKSFDEQRRETSALLESRLPEADSDRPRPTQPIPPQAPRRAAAPSESPSPQPPASVLLVDDEPPIREVVGGVLRSAGYRVYSASSPAEAMGMASEIRLSRQDMLVVTDLGMPTTSGRSFKGGFELVRSLQRNGLKPPVLLITEKLSSKARARARSLGIRKVALKPALSKLDPEQYRQDLEAFARTVVRLLRDLEQAPAEEDTAPETTATGEDGASAPFLDYLASMTEQLLDPRRSVDVAQLVLRVASKYLDRGVLFLNKGDKVMGLAGFGFVSTEQASVEVARSITFVLEQARPFAEVVYGGKTKRFSSELDSLQACLYSAVGRGRATECVLIPMLNNGEVLVILYGDNAASGRPIGKLRGLELFISQAGMTLENIYLHRKLRAFETAMSQAGPSAPVATEANRE